MGFNIIRALALGTAIAISGGACSLVGPGVPSYRNEAGNVNSIEMAWGDGSGMGAFVDSTVTGTGGPAASSPGLRYRVRVVFDTGFAATVVQDGSVPLSVGERVWIQDGKVLPHDAPETDPKRNLAHF
jgi:hypothetical protein